MKIFWLGGIAALTFFGGDYLRRRRRAEKIFRASQTRVVNVGTRDVIARELEDTLTREQVLAKLPAAMRDYDQRRYDVAWGFIPRELRLARFLDAGCGDGFILQETRRFFSQQFKEFFGSDISHYKCIRARARLGDHAALNVANLEQLPYRSDTFEVVLCTEVLEHLLNVQTGVAELRRVLTPNGRLIFSTPSKHPMFFSYTNPFTWLEALVGLFLPAALPPFHNLERPTDPNSVVHRAFTIQELQNELHAFSRVKIRTTKFRLPGFLYRRVRSPRVYARIERFLSQIPVLNRLGETLIICAVK